MLEDDLKYNRTSSRRNASSVLNFCQFLKTAGDGTAMTPANLPLQHVARYHEIVARLIEAGELPVSAKQQFDLTFGTGFFKTLADGMPPVAATGQTRIG
jgi:hypothetical protein